MSIIRPVNYRNDEYMKEVKKRRLLENKIKEVNKITLTQNATNGEITLLEHIKNILKINLKTNKDIEYPQMGTMKEVTISKGAKVEENKKSPTGYFLSPSNFDENSINFHDAEHYGFIVKKEDVEEDVEEEE